MAKVIFGQILEYSVHCITLAKGKKKKENGNSRVTFLSCLACQHLTSQLLIGHFNTTQMKQWERNVVSG